MTAFNYPTNAPLKEALRKYREILIERYCNDLTYEELSEKADMSVSQVKRICYRYGMEVFRIMGKQK